MRKLIFGLLLLIPILMGCKEDEDKVIQTDLPTEAAELFSISKDWNESLYFAMLSWEQYQQMDTVGLPSCPDIQLDENIKQVTLNFPGSTSCNQAGQYSRSGTLILKYDTSLVSPNQRWTMEYKDYFFESNSIEGIRSFSSDDSLLISEEFTELIEKTENELSTEFSGKFLHTKTYFSESIPPDSIPTDSIPTDSIPTDSLSNDTLAIPPFISFTSTGRIQGVNAAGRDFEITIDSPIQHSITCYQQNEILPSVGKSSWFVSRGGTSEVSYDVTYETLFENCKVAVNTTLPDGKKLLLNPIE